jgi:hypothetical protein
MRPDRRHLAEAAAEQLLHGGGAVGIGIGRRRQLGLQAVDAIGSRQVYLSVAGHGQ